MEYDRPYVCTKESFEKKKVWLDAVNFLKIDSAPKEFKSVYLKLLNFFSFNVQTIPLRFQRLVNLLIYGRVECDPSNEKAVASERQRVVGELLEESISLSDVYKLRALLDCVVMHLGVSGKIDLPPVPIYVGTRSTKILNTEWGLKLPQELRFWSVVAERKRLEVFSSSLDPVFVNAAEKWYAEASEYRHMSSGANLMRHYFVYMGKSTFVLSEFAKMVRMIGSLSTTSRTPSPVLDIYSDVFGEDLTKAYARERNEENFKISDVPNIYRSEIIAERKQLGMEDPFDFSRPVKKFTSSGVGVARSNTVGLKGRGSLSQKLPVTMSTYLGTIFYKANLGFVQPADHAVYEVDSKESINIGEYGLWTSLLQKHRPDNLFDKYVGNYWLLHQKDYLEASKYEKSTLNFKKGSLRIFNTYVFSYLEWFKENIDPSFHIPGSIEEFNPNVFVRRTHSYLARHASNKILPVTFPEFMEKALNLGAKGGAAGANTVKGHQNNIVQYFESIKMLEGASFNPVEQMAKVRGSSYQESQKTKLDYEYWILFRQFMHIFSWCSLLAYKDMLDSGAVSQEQWKINFLAHAKDKKFEFGDISLDFAGLEGLDEFDFDSIHIFSSLIYFVSECGLRFSNAFWLDATNFDSNAPAEANDRDYYEVFVNTDKSKLRAFHTHVPFNVIRQLRILNQVRSDVFGDETVFYQDNENSKWKEIVPLFRFKKAKHDEKNHSAITDAIADLVFSFQSILRKKGVNFSSYLYPWSPGISYKDFEIYKATRTQAPIRYFALEREPFYAKSDQSPRPFSPIRYKSVITIHGLRKTFDSFWSNILSNEMLGDLFTGQSPVMVGFYTSNTRADHHKALSVAARAGLPVNLQEFNNDAQARVQSIKENGIGPELIAIASADSDDFDLNDEYRRAPDKNIAVNRTHICPYANRCPKKIRDLLGNKKLCGICPASLSVKSDAPAIAAEIRRLGDEVADISLAIKSDELNSGELEEYRERRINLLPKISAWVCRHEHLVRMMDGELLIGEDGHSHFQQQVKYQSPDVVKTWSQEKQTLHRIFETSDVKTMQSERLKIQAKRMARRLTVNLNHEALDKIDVDPVREAALHVKKHATLNGLSMDEVVRALEYDTKELPSISFLTDLTKESGNGQN